MFAYPSRRIESTPLANIWVHLAVWLGVALQALTLVVAPLRTLLRLVPISWAIFTTIMLTALLTWGLAEIPCRRAAGKTPWKPGRVPRRND
jgi:Ca2+-transporting ATPase